MDKKRLFITKVINLLAVLLLVGVMSTDNAHKVKPASSEVLTNTSMAQVLGGDNNNPTFVFESNNNYILIGTLLGAGIGFFIAGPGGAVEGAFWGSLLFWLIS